MFTFEPIPVFRFPARSRRLLIKRLTRRVSKIRSAVTKQTAKAGAGHTLMLGMFAFCLVSAQVYTSAISQALASRLDTEDVQVYLDAMEQLHPSPASFIQLPAAKPAPSGTGESEPRIDALVLQQQMIRDLKALKSFASPAASSITRSPLKVASIAGIDATTGPLSNPDFLHPLAPLPAEQALEQPTPAQKAPAIQPQKAIQRAFKMMAPLKQYVMTSSYGWRHGRPHRGIDMAASLGSTIYSTEDGTVSLARPYYGYGNLVEITHAHGLKTRYAHLGKMLVKSGHKVLKGQMIGTIGMTGSTTGPHLHFEVIANALHKNPKLFF